MSGRLKVDTTAVAERLARLWSRCSENHRKAAREAGPVPVHDLRVSARRLMVLAAAADSALPKTEYRRFSAFLEKSLDLTGRLSDLQAMIGRVGEVTVAADDPDPFLDHLRRLECETRRKASVQLRRAGLAGQQRRMRLLLARLEAAGPLSDLSVSRALESAVVDGLRRVGKRRRALDRDRIETIHRLRTALRRVRYALEAARIFQGERLAGALAATRKLQTRMGAIHDFELLAAELAEHVPAAVGGRTARAIDTRLRREIAGFWREVGLIDQVRLPPPVRPAPRRGSSVRVVLVRHASAVPRGTSGIAADAARPLTPEGRMEADALGQWLSTVVQGDVVVMTSPALRALETARIVVARFGPGLRPALAASLAPTGDPAAVASLAREVCRAGVTLVLVGHEPVLGQAAGLLMSGGTGMAPALGKAGAVQLRLDADRERDARIEWLVDRSVVVGTVPKEGRRTASGPRRRVAKPIKAGAGAD